MRTDIPTVAVLGVPIARLTSAQALDEIERLRDAAAPGLVAFVNAHSLNLATTDREYRRVLGRADLVLNDGSGVAIAARLQGVTFPENLNGTDLSPRMLDLARRRRWRVFLLGAKPGVAEAARSRLFERLPGLEVVGVHDGYFGDAQVGGVVAEIRQLDVDLLLVGMGNPAQERWLHRHLDASGARVGVAVGAYLDFAADQVPRAPAWVRRCNLEWAYRLLVEPKRLWRRYVVGNPLFLWRVVCAQWGRRPPPSDAC